MNESWVARLVGLCAVAGGATLVAACLVHDSLPRGCVGDECEVRPMRDSTASSDLLFTVAGLLLVATCAGLLLLVHRTRGLGRLGVIGAAGCALGLGSLATGSIIQAAFAHGDLTVMPAFVLTGFASLAVGLVLLAVTVLRSGLLPRWTGALLVAGALLLPVSNEQNDTILLTVPLGLALITAGVLLFRGRTLARSGGGRRQMVVPV